MHSWCFLHHHCRSILATNVTDIFSSPCFLHRLTPTAFPTYTPTVRYYWPCCCGGFRLSDFFLSAPCIFCLGMCFEVCNWFCSKWLKRAACVLLHRTTKENVQCQAIGSKMRKTTTFVLQSLQSTFQSFAPHGSVGFFINFSEVYYELG